MADMRIVKQITIHCSASQNGASLFQGKLGDKNFRTPVQVIDGWHRERGFNRQQSFRNKLNPGLTSVGYHFVIYTNGTAVTGRHLDEVGAGVAGQNSYKIHICMIGTSKFMPDQWIALAELVTNLKTQYPQATIEGHRDCSPDKNKDGKITPNEWVKTCPGFDAKVWFAKGMVPSEDHIQEVLA